MRRAGLARALLVLLGCGAGCAALAQSLSPRAYVVTPVSANALITQYSYLDGNINFNGAVPITGATAGIDVEALAYYHSFGLLGHAANIDVSVPYAEGDFKGTVRETPAQVNRTGMLDATARFAVNLLGGPALSYQDFRKWQQTTLLGASLTVVAPTGQYDPTRLINYGNNRWAFKPELGYSRRTGHWVLDVYGGVWIFTRNDEFFSHNQYVPGSQYQDERPVGVVETHLSYDVRERLWVSLDANYWWGGETSINGRVNPVTNQQSSRVGITASIPLTRRLSLKFSAADGAYVRYGGNYQIYSVALQYGWIGWRFL